MTRFACMIAALAFTMSPVLAGLDDVKVATDTSIDCSSVQTIARDLYKNCKTDEEKAIATWYFVRRVEFHWPNIPTWDTVELINSYGFGLCGYQSTAYVQIATAGGLKARTCHLPSHVIAEAFYDDAWHMFDCQVGWYACNRKGKVASCEEMKADPTLVTDAIKENRASKPYFQCRDNPGAGTNYAAQAKPGGTPQPPQNRLVIKLRRGESITRVWGNENKPWFSEKGNDGKPNTTFMEPRHSCTGKGIDDNDPVNWPFWRLYANPNGAPYKRYYGNGRLVYAPDLSSADCLGDLPKSALVNLKPGAGLVAGEKEASITIPIDSPYIITDAWLDLAGVKADDATLTVSAKSEKGEWKELYKAEKAGQVKVESLSLKDAAFRGKKYEVKVAMQSAKAGDVTLGKLSLTTVFINNMYALPYLTPGKNSIKLTAADGADIAKNKLTLDYAWEEDGKEKTLSKTIDKLPFEASVEVGGKELPRMKSVRMAVAP